MKARRLIDFEAVDRPSGGLGEVPDGYGGLDWNNAFAVDAAAFPGSGYSAAARDSLAAGYNGDSRPVRFALPDGADFGFRSCFAAAAWNNDLGIRVEGFRDWAVVALAEFTLTPTAEKIRLARDFDRDFLEVDAVRISSFGGDNAGLGGNGRNVAFDDLVLLV